MSSRRITDTERNSSINEGLPEVNKFEGHANYVQTQEDVLHQAPPVQNNIVVNSISLMGIPVVKADDNTFGHDREISFGEQQYAVIREESEKDRPR